MVFLLPASPAHAATPTVTLSASSGTFGSSLTITGTGFGSAKTIAITTTVGSTVYPWLTLNGCATTNGGNSGTDSLVSANCLTTDASGAFETAPTVPDMPGGAQTISVTDGVSTATAAFTMSSSISQTITSSHRSGYAGQTETDTLTVHGFGNAESVSFASPLFVTAPTACTTTAAGTCASASTTFVIAEQVAGAKTITATGATTALTGTTSFTVKSYVAFYNSQTGSTTFSFLGTAPTSLLIEGHGFTAGTSSIAANSITVGGVATTHSAITVGADGTFGAGQSNHVVVSPNANVPFGAVSVVIAGTTFSFANGNIAQTSGGSAPVVGGVLISSIVGTGGSTGVGSLDASTHGFGDSVTAFGYGFRTGAVTVSNTNLPGITFGVPTNSIQTLTPDANGAIFEGSTTGAGPATTLTNLAAGSYTVTFTEAPAAVANIISPSYTISQVVTTSVDSTTTPINYGSAMTVSVHGFAASTAVTVSAGGKTLATIAAGTIGAGGGAAGQAATTPDIASGTTYAATATDGTHTGTDASTFFMAPYVDLTGGSAMTSTTGQAGATTVLRTASTFGVHGLAANTVYTVNNGMLGAAGAHTLGTFTSTSTGGIPVPGVQFTIPAGVTGNQLYTLVTGGADALFGNTLANTATTVGPTSAYGDLVFSLGVSVLTSPTVVNVGTSFTLSGTGLKASTLYEETVTATANGAGATGQLYGSFTSDASGNIPAGTSLTMPAAPTIPLAANCNTATYAEQGTSYYVHLSTATQYPGAQDGQGAVVVAGAASLNMTTASPGHGVLMTASGLGNGCTYDVIFNYGTNPQATAYTGTLVGAFTATSTGSTPGTGAVLTIPSSAASGTYPIQLIRLTGPALGVLSNAASVTVSSVNTSSCNNTSCMVTTPPVSTTLNGNHVVQTSWTNNSNAPLTAIVYAVVHNAAGQTVYYSTATVTAAAGGSATAYDVLFGLAPGSYTVTVFVTSTGGTAISTTSTVSVTI